jgi:hypothetical protein
MRIGQKQAKGYLEEDFQEAFQRYISRSDMDALRAQLGQRSEDRGQRSEGEEKKPDAGEQKTEANGGNEP